MSNETIHIGKFRGFLDDRGLDSVDWEVFHGTYESHLGTDVPYYDHSFTLSLNGEIIYIYNADVARALAGNLLAYADAIDIAEDIVETNEEQV
jgi:hypothetical protein